MLSIDAGRVVEPEGWADEWYLFESLVLGLGRGGEHERGIQAGTPSLGFYAPPIAIGVCGQLYLTSYMRPDWIHRFLQVPIDIIVGFPAGSP